MSNKFAMQRSKFIAEYIKTGNATQSAITAGYSPKTANEQASRLLSKDSVQKLIGEAKAKIISKAILTKQRALQILSDIAEADLSDFMSIGQDGVTYVDFAKETCRRKALRKAKTRTIRDEHGNTVVETMFNEVELEDKVRAIERISKMMGWDTPEKAEVNLSSTSIEQVLKDIAEAGGKWWRRRAAKNGLTH